ncbi:MAG: hypothetical protein U0U67_14770 [Chitinophagales bacterium]
MSDDIIDNEFYDEEVILPRTWWENRRLKYNKICLAYAFIIIFIVLFRNIGDTIGIILEITFFYWIAGNIVYTFSWILENLLIKIADFSFSENMRIFIFWFGIIITFIPPSFFLGLFLSDF